MTDQWPTTMSEGSQGIWMVTCPRSSERDVGDRHGCCKESWTQHKEDWMVVRGAKVVGSTPVWAIHLRAGLDDPCGFLPTQNILWSVISHLYWGSGLTGCATCVNQPIVPSELINHFSVPWLIKGAEIVTQLSIRYPIQNVNNTEYKNLTTTRVTDVIWILVIYILPAAQDSGHIIENYVSTVIQLFIPAVYSDYLYLCCDSSMLLYHLAKSNFHVMSKEIQISKFGVEL